jgi:hypothetical protein
MKPQKFIVILADEDGNVIKSWDECVTEQSFYHFNTEEDDPYTFPSWEEIHNAAQRHENGYVDKE